MNHQALSGGQKARMLQYAAWLFGVGLVVGLILVFKAIGHVAAWPLLPAVPFDVPGTERAWLRAHLGLMVNAIAMIAFACAGGLVALRGAGRRLYVGSVIVTGYANSLGFILGALFSVRGLEYGGPIANSAVYLCFLAAVVTALIQAVLLATGARQILRQGEA